MPGQALVDERIVGRQQIQQVLVNLFRNALEAMVAMAASIAAVVETWPVAASAAVVSRLSAIA